MTNIRDKKWSFRQTLNSKEYISTIANHIFEGFMEWEKVRNIYILFNKNNKNRW